MLVVGSGISGAVIAEVLSRHFDVVVVDRRGPALGSTTASTALVVYEVDVPLIRLQRRIGKENAIRAWQRSHLALSALMARTRELGIACEATRRDCLYLAGTLLDGRALQREVAARRAIGLETIFLSQAALMARFGIKRRGALLAYDDYAVNPVKMAEGYLAAAVRNGAVLRSPVDVTRVEALRSGVVAETGAGPTIRAKYLVLATGYELPIWVPNGRHRVVSTYAIATAPQRRDRLWPGPSLIWEASDPYLYIRTTRGGRIICGGEDDDFADDKRRDAAIPNKATAISNKLKQLFPALDTRAALAWAGAFGTPYWYAEEMLVHGKGRLVPFRDAAAIAAEVTSLLGDDVERNAMRKRAYVATRKMIWKEVAAQYFRLLRDVRRERGVRARQTRLRVPAATTFELPYPRLDHLRVLTDDTGILQHACFDIPDRDHGYCTDDNARALIVVLRAQHVLPDSDLLSSLAHRYLGFLQQAFNAGNGRFRNFMSYGRVWQEEAGSEDSHGRAMWALGQTVLDSPSQGMAAAAMALFDQALPRTIELIAPRACAHALIGLDAYLRRFSGATEVRRAHVLLCERLTGLFEAQATPDWPWPEKTLTYANGVIPEAMLLAGARLGNTAVIDTAKRALDWLTRLQIDARGHLVPIGNRGWFSRDGTQARFDQQPIEVQHMTNAHLAAYRVTGERRSLEEARRCFEWFLGRNDLRQPVCDHATGGCRDGLQAEGLNQNQGAESTLAWLDSLISLHVASDTSVAEVDNVAPMRRRAPATMLSLAERAAGAPN